jgi:hypothetical protein
LDTDVALFVFRLISGVVLLAVLGLLFAVMWRDYRGAVAQAEANRRSYGRMIEMREIDHALVVTGQTYPLLPLTSLGRAPTNSIPIPDDFASGEHCLLALRSGQWWLEDRQSKNGTTINGVPVTQPLIITDGDVIGIGSTRFRLELEQ